jgi:hypothetical protein
VLHVFPRRGIGNITHQRGEDGRDHQPLDGPQEKQGKIVIGQGEQQFEDTEDGYGPAYQDLGREGLQQVAVKKRGDTERGHHQGGEEDRLETGQIEFFLKYRLDRLSSIE